MGNFEEFSDCVNAVKAAGGRYFVYGFGLNGFQCWLEPTSSVDCNSIVFIFTNGTNKIQTRKSPSTIDEARYDIFSEISVKICKGGPPPKTTLNFFADFGRYFYSSRKYV